MSALSHAVAFFDIGNTLAAVRVSTGGDRIEQLTVFPQVVPVLQRLRESNVRLGILSARGAIPAANVTDALTRAGLLQFFESALILFGTKNSPALFERAAAVVRGLDADSSQPPAPLLFVGKVAEEKEIMGTTIVSYQQMYNNLPVWKAGVSVTIQPELLRVTASQSSVDANLSPAPDAAALDGSAAAAAYAPEKITPDTVKTVLKVKAKSDLKINGTRELYYRFAHSAGDSLAAIYSDPESALRTDPVRRFQTFPWILPDRNHGRTVASGWG